MNLVPADPRTLMVDDTGKPRAFYTRGKPGQRTDYIPTANVPTELVISADAPVDADGRPDGTIYIQTA